MTSKYSFIPVLHADQTNLTVSPDHQLSHCYANEKIFKELLKSGKSGEEGHPSVETMVFPCLSHAIRWMESLCDSSQPHLSTTAMYTSSTPASHSSQQIAVLVTGSLHLVGDMMSALGFTIEDV